MIPPRASRPDLVDTFVELWLSAAVGFAALATAPLNAFRHDWPHPDDKEGGEEPEAVPGDGGPSTVSAVRPEDMALQVDTGLASHERCGNCRHFRRANAQAGECRHDAPILDEDGGAVWPITTIHEWCGRFFHAHVPGLTQEDRDALH